MVIFMEVVPGYVRSATASLSKRYNKAINERTLCVLDLATLGPLWRR